MSRKLTNDAAGQMADLRKRFRGGRPVKPRPCPRCGASCASATQAAAHCVGPAVRDREAARQWAALSPEERKRRYPKWKYHRTKPAVLVEDPQEEAELGAEWADKPFPQNFNTPRQAGGRG